MIGWIFDLNKNPHARMILSALYAEKKLRIKFPFRLFRVLIAQGVYHVELAPDSLSLEAIATLSLPHPYNIIVHPKSTIGRNCVLFQGVTIGERKAMGGDTSPTIKDNVLIGANSVILGPITIGTGAKIGALSIVTHNVDCNLTIIGKH